MKPPVFCLSYFEAWSHVLCTQKKGNLLPTLPGKTVTLVMVLRRHEHTLASQYLCYDLLICLLWLLFSLLELLLNEQNILWYYKRKWKWITLPLQLSFPFYIFIQSADIWCVSILSHTQQPIHQEILWLFLKIYIWNLTTSPLLCLQAHAAIICHAN